MKYNKLLNDYKKVLRLNQQIGEQNVKLKQEINEIREEMANMSNFSVDQITLDQFKKMYLTQRYTSKDMPSKAGIYAYFNNKTKQLYIGQSVNMRNRLKQHFRRGSLKIDGHDSEFTDQSDWSFYVLEYIPRENKKKLDDREAFWIALGKLAVSDKTVHDYQAVNQFTQSLKDPHTKSRNIKTSKKIKGQGELTNRTRGNNVRM